MQRYLQLILYFIVSFSFAQEVKTQKDILQIPNTDLIKDFNLKVKESIKPITVIKSTYIDVGFGYESQSFNYLKKDYSIQTLTFEGNKLVSNVNKFQNAFGKPNTFYFYYTYDEKGTLKSSTSKSSNAGKLDGNDEKSEYSFYNNGLIKEKKHKGSGKVKNQQYSYKNNTLSYNFSNGTTTYHLNNGLVSKEVTFNKSANKTYIKSYNYNNNSYVNLEDGESYKYTYLLNENNLIEKEATKNYTKHYKYVYDKYGNWIIAYPLSISYKDYNGNKTKAHLYGSKFSFYVREIKYSNGEVTGNVNPDNISTKDKIIKLRTELYNTLVKGKKSSLDSYTESATNVAEGLGKLSKYFNGECVKGDCNNGYGERKYTDGKIAEGFFKDGQPNGPMHTSDTKKNSSLFSSYAGSFKKKDAFTYEYDGKNLSVYSDKSKSTGFYNDYKTKKTYILYFSNGKVTSKKELNYNDSKTCVVGNCTNGVGIYVYGNGATYMGTFTGGKRNGFGTLFFKNGNQYIGEFYNGNYNGLGTYIWSENNYYLGMYKDGKYNGKGVMYYNKTKYDAGTWVNGKFQGKATITSNITNTNSSSSNTNTNSTGFNIFSETQKNRVLACKNNTECLSRYLTSLYIEKRKSLSGKALIRKTTDYFHSVYTMNPKLAYDTLFKMDMSLINLKMLPPEVQKDLRKRAKGLADGYKKFKKKKGY